MSDEEMELEVGPRLLGAIPTPRAKLASATPHVVRGSTPTQFIVIPPNLSYWYNNRYGDCVTAEEAFAKACYQPEIFIQDATVMSFASKHGLLNGAMLLDVIKLMISDGFHQDGRTYSDGTPSSVDYTDAPTLQNAISQGPVKIGVAAGQLLRVANGKNGWYGLNFQRDGNMDHCVSLCGYGPVSWLASQLKVAVPPGADGTEAAYALFTWSCIGIISVQSMLNITSEAWLRTPTTIANPPLPAPPVPDNWPPAPQPW